ncbi:MAG: helix-turn-helix transcriptional regulator [Ruminococcaceae bacterium]|nr:helix-turn-helix transcriptional regulator [Oscillospiraceae bacterium]
MNIGNNIKQLRQQKNLTQEQLAEKLGISYQAVSKWETGISHN